MLPSSRASGQSNDKLVEDIDIKPLFFYAASGILGRETDIYTFIKHTSVGPHHFHSSLICS